MYLLSAFVLKLNIETASSSIDDFLSISPRRSRLTIFLVLFRPLTSMGQTPTKEKQQRFRYNELGISVVSDLKSIHPELISPKSCGSARNTPAPPRSSGASRRKNGQEAAVRKPPKESKCKSHCSATRVVVPSAPSLDTRGGGQPIVVKCRRSTEESRT